MLRLVVLVLVLGQPLVAMDLSTAIARVASATDVDAVETLIAVSELLPSLPEADGMELVDATEALAERVFLSPVVLPGMERIGLSVHTVASGELPGGIMKRYAMSDALLKVINPDYDDRRLGVGQRLKVLDRTRVELVVAVSKSAFRGLVFARVPNATAPILVAVFPVGIGASDRPTPTGETSVSVRVRNPEWRHPDTGEVIPPGDPRNVLGGYWIGLAAGPAERFASIGFHGYTGAPAGDWLEQGGSRGCLRLLQDDIAQLFALTTTGTPVLVME